MLGFRCGSECDRGRVGRSPQGDWKRALCRGIAGGEPGSRQADRDDSQVRDAVESTAKETGTTSAQTAKSRPMPCPTPCRARVQGEYFTTRAALSNFVGVTWTATDGIVGPILSLRPLSGSGARLQPLRPRSDLLRWRLRADDAAGVDPAGGSALPAKPPRPLQPRRTHAPLSGPPRECDASGFPRAGGR